HGGRRQHARRHLPASLMRSGRTRPLPSRHRTRPPCPTAEARNGYGARPLPHVPSPDPGARESPTMCLPRKVELMKPDRDPMRATLGLTCEALEARQLLSAIGPAWRAVEVRSLDRARPSLKAPSLFIEPQAGRAPIIQAINSARSDIRLGICNLSDPR